MSFVGPIASKKALQVQNGMAESSKVTPSPVGSVAIPGAAEKNTPGGTPAGGIGFGTFDFDWPGGDFWDIYRGEQLVVSNLRGHATQALQAGTYTIKPKFNAAFLLFDIQITDGKTTKVP